jgi:hypothetical protein
MGTAAPPAGDVGTFRFSTDDYSKRRPTAWREIFGRTVCNLDIEPLAADRFRSNSTIYARPGLKPDDPAHAGDGGLWQWRRHRRPLEMPSSLATMHHSSRC